MDRREEVSQAKEGQTAPGDEDDANQPWLSPDLRWALARNLLGEDTKELREYFWRKMASGNAW